MKSRLYSVANDMNLPLSAVLEQALATLAEKQKRHPSKIAIRYLMDIR